MSDSDDGKESFEVNDFDLNAALNPGASRRRPTREQQIYGVSFIEVYYFIRILGMWAGNESDDDENNSGRRGFGARNRNDKYSSSGPVKFVSGGVNKADNARSGENATKATVCDF
jgi:tuftelin-interacting protein 11